MAGLIAIAIAVCVLNSVEPSPVMRSLQAARATAFVPCLKNSDCYPTALVAVPSDYIKCESYNCICSSNCFKLNGFICDFSVCGQYSNVTNNCTTASDLKDQKTAFLLSLFLSSTGAANFYIGRNDLDVACTVILMSISGAVILIITVILALITISWWIADLVVFVNNERTDGSGCPLTASL
eukprot:Em0001g2392a